MGAVVNCVAYQDGKRVADVPVEDISEVLKQDDHFVWIGLHEPDEALLRQVQEEFCLHDLAIEDALRAHQRPKVEEYGDSLFVVLRTAHWNGDRHAVECGETHLFIGPRYAISIRHGASLSYTAVRERAEKAPKLLRKGPGFVLYAIIDFVVDNYFPVVDALECDLEALERDIFGPKPKRETTERIYDLKGEVLELKHAVAPLVEVCNRLQRFEQPLIAKDTRLYLRDVYDHVIRINESIDILRELLTQALEANLALISLQQNDITKGLAAWAAIIAVPTMIAGVYGMNFELMPELSWRFGYPFAIGMMLAACGSLYAYFRRAGWL